MYHSGRHPTIVCLGGDKVLPLNHHESDELFVSGCVTTTASENQRTINTPYSTIYIAEHKRTYSGIDYATLPI